MNRVVRVLAVSAGAVVSLTCSDQAVTSRAVGYARIPLAPVFATAPAGGPDIDVDRIRGVLHGATDSSVADALVDGDSAILEFQNVIVHGDSTKFELEIQAFDSNVVVFEGSQTLQVKPGDNAPANPDLHYTAPDSIAASIDISVTALALDWAGADSANRSCLSHPGKYPNVRSQQLSVTGMTSNNVTVNGVRVGWTSRDTTVFSVDSTGFVRSKCSNKSAYLVARTFLDKADSIVVTVTAPPFSLRMEPDSASIQRGSTRTFTAIVVDELANELPAASVTWTSSDTTRAKVSASGVVTGIANGRVLITAGSGGRTTVGVVQVVRPSASKVVVQPATALDSVGVNQSRAYFAKALDATNRVIPEATGFVWSTNLPALVNVNATTGLATGVSAGIGAFVKVTLDGKRDSVALSVLTLMPGGGIKGKVTNAATGGPLQNAVVSSSVTNTVNTLADGSFTLNNLQNGDDITITLTGYAPITAYYVPVFPNKVIEVPAVPMSPTGSNSSFTGKVVNAVSGNAVSGVKVRAYTGVNGGPTPKRPSVTAVDSATTDANGNYTFSNRPVGVYTLLFSATGYSDAIAGANSVSGVTKTVGDVLLPPTAVGGGLYILVTWGVCGATNVPCNLDAHLTGPKIAPDTVPPRFQVYSGNLRYIVGADTIAALDLADNNGTGPEIISIRPAAPTGVYKFYVHNATAGTTPNLALADSASARVDVYQDNHLIGTFFPPSGQSGTVWNVFDYDGARLIPVGTITSPANPAVLALRAWDLPADIGPASLKVRPRVLVGR